MSDVKIVPEELDYEL